MGEGHFGNFLYMSEGKFMQRMKYLESSDYHVIGLGEGVAALKDGNIKPNSVVVTIDDGWYSTYRCMFPALQACSIPATVYLTSYYCEKQLPVVTVLLNYLLASTSCKEVIELDLAGRLQVFDLSVESDKGRLMACCQGHLDSLDSEEGKQSFLEELSSKLGVDYQSIISKQLFHLMTPAQVQEMASCGVDFQLHTHCHTISKQETYCIEDEIVKNSQFINSLVDIDLVHFCYPSGIYDPQIWPELEKLNVESATTTEIGLADKNTHKYAIPRILDGEQISDIEFEAELSGFNDMVRRILSVCRSQVQ